MSRYVVLQFVILIIPKHLIDIFSNDDFQATSDHISRFDNS